MSMKRYCASEVFVEPGHFSKTLDAIHSSSFAGSSAPVAKGSAQLLHANKAISREYDSSCCLRIYDGLMKKWKILQGIKEQFPLCPQYSDNQTADVEGDIPRNNTFCGAAKCHVRAL